VAVAVEDAYASGVGLDDEAENMWIVIAMTRKRRTEN
jgi:hypothetical protein